MRELRSIVDPQSVIDDSETMRPYECDGLSMYREMPRVVVIPDKLDQVGRVLCFCHQHGIPVVTRGAGTGLSAGAMPHPWFYIVAHMDLDGDQSSYSNGGCVGGINPDDCTVLTATSVNSGVIVRNEGN